MLTRDQCLLLWGQTGPGQEPVRDQDQDIHPDSGDRAWLYLPTGIYSILFSPFFKYCIHEKAKKVRTLRHPLFADKTALYQLQLRLRLRSDKNVQSCKGCPTQSCKCLYQWGINIPDADSMLRASVFNGLVIIAAIQDIRNTVIASAVNFTLDPALFAGKTLVNLELFEI